MPVYADPPAQVATMDPVSKDAELAQGGVNPLKDTFFNRDKKYTLTFPNNTKAEIGLSNAQPKDEVGQAWDQFSFTRPSSFSGSYQANSSMPFVARENALPGRGYGLFNSDPQQAFIDGLVRRPSQFDSIMDQLNVDRFDWAIVSQDGKLYQRYQANGAGFRGAADINADSIRLEAGGEYIENLVNGLTGNNFKALNVRATNNGSGWQLGSSAALETGPLTFSIGSGVDDYFNLAKNGRLLHNTMFSAPEGADVFGSKLHVASYDFSESPGLIASELKLGNCSLIMANDPINKTNVLAGRGFAHLKNFLGQPLHINGEGAYLQQRDQLERLHQGIGGGIQFLRPQGSNDISLQLRGYGTKSDGNPLLPTSQRGGKWTGEFSLGLEFLR
jgi:hypothetical protein